MELARMSHFVFELKWITNDTNQLSEHFKVMNGLTAKFADFHAKSCIILCPSFCAQLDFDFFPTWRNRWRIC